MSNIKIDVRVPYEPEGRLGWDYNRILSETLHDWVLVVDHDVLLNTCPLWYHICQRVIDLYPNTGLFTCKTNALHRTDQHDPSAPKDFDLAKHQKHAEKIWLENNYNCKTVEKNKNIAGFFMLINKSSWTTVGGFPGQGMFEEDWAFAKKLHAQNIPIRVIEGLYLLHAQKRIGSWSPDVKTSREIYKKEIIDKQ
jgi:GT2 family glycosyltransferase